MHAAPRLVGAANACTWKDVYREWCRLYYEHMNTIYMKNDF